VVGKGDWAKQLESNKRWFTDLWVQRPAFQAVFGALSNTSYVDTLIAHTGVPFADSERQALISALNTSTATRAEVLRQIAENRQFVESKRNALFVRMQYFGYLRRDPDAEGY